MFLFFCIAPFATVSYVSKACWILSTITHTVFHTHSLSCKNAEIKLNMWLLCVYVGRPSSFPFSPLKQNPTKANLTSPLLTITIIIMVESAPHSQYLSLCYYLITKNSNHSFFLPSAPLAHSHVRPST